jgi:acyl-CoA reductase-like NAD-dependent aldehyde dehydrogenase
MNSGFKVVSPVNGEVIFHREYADPEGIDRTLEESVAAWLSWRKTPLSDRLALLDKVIDHIVADTDQIAEELTWQIGRPIRYTPGEVSGFEQRGRHMISIAEASLSDVTLPHKGGFERSIRREPLGVVLVLAAWNYPYLIAVNTVLPALAAGNVVVLKHADQTATCAERLAKAMDAAGIPKGVFQFLHMTHDDVAKAVADSRVAHVAFTGSVAGGQAVHRAAAGHLKQVGLELGGKDPAYVREDANLEYTVSQLVDGAFFNSGQSCCGVERIYVHQDRYLEFVEAFVEQVYGYVLGNPTDPAVTLGPVVRARNAKAIQGQIHGALAAGARALIDPARFPNTQLGVPYLPPQVLVDVQHSMDVMREETFGPVVGIMPVSNDEEGVQMMNDSRYGLTASVWTKDLNVAETLSHQIETGTVFLNRCDILDPALAWVGVKESGRGCTLSSVGYEAVTRPKSIHFRTMNDEPEQ